MLLRFLTSALSLITAVYAHSIGVDTCESAPQHGTWAQGCNPSTCVSAGGSMLNLPFVILAFDSNNMPINSYMPNTNYNVILTSTNGSSAYKGFVFNVGRGNINGNFAVVSAASSGAGNLTLVDTTSRRMSSCTNGITHVNNMNKLTNSFSWLSPPTGSRSVTFKSIVVTSRTSVNYVVSLRLNEMNTNPSVSPTPTPLITTTSSCSIPYIPLSGVSGVTPSYIISTSGSTSVLGGASPTCQSGFGTSSGAKLAFMIDLGATTVLGSQLTVDTCLTAIGDTVLYVGTGCPSSSASFRCLMANDDIGSILCPSDSMASQVRLNVSTRYVWAVVGNYASSTTASSGISWYYGSALPPSVPSMSGPTVVTTVSPGLLLSASQTPRGSRSSTMSNSITYTSSATISRGVEPSSTNTVSPSMVPSMPSTLSSTSSVSNTMTPSQTFSDSLSRSSTQSPTQTITSMETYTPSNSKSMPPSPTRTASSTDTPSHTPIETDTPTYTETSSPSYTSNPSQSFGGSLTQTPLAFQDLTKTATPTINYNSIPIMPANVAPQNNALVITGIALGVIASIVIMLGLYMYYTNSKKPQRPISMKNIIFIKESSEYISKNPYSKKQMESSTKQIFDPVAVRSDNNI